MTILDDLLNRVTDVLNGLQGGEIPRLAVLPYGERIVDLQREQLAEGKAADGNDLRPYYSEDLRAGGGYFKSSQSAANYAAWKETIDNPYQAGERNADAPNLYINGKFYSELGVEFGTERARIVPLTPWAAGIVAKYGADSFGLQMRNWMRIFAEGAMGDLMNEVRRRLYG